MTKDKGNDKTKVSMELMHELLKQIQGSLSSVEKSIEEKSIEEIGVCVAAERICAALHISSVTAGTPITATEGPSRIEWWTAALLY